MLARCGAKVYSGRLPQQTGNDRWIMGAQSNLEQHHLERWSPSSTSGKLILVKRPRSVKITAPLVPPGVSKGIEGMRCS
jgi:hypothetical protein